ncbi:MAG: sugar transferase [Marmoricola sp.]|nr:sugar transferase [Marmoricola sp.]
MGQRIVAAVLLMVLAPVLALISLLVLAFDRGPVLFRQDRLGVARRPFSIYKFKTMVGGRPTRLGAVLRRTGADELLQLANIAAGDMRFIGPRPLTEADVLRLEWDTPDHDTRWLVQPGITGYAQLAPVCDRAVSWSLDDFYAQHRTRVLDLKITLASGAALFLGKQRAKAWFWR